MDRFERTYGSLLGLALGDAISYPAALHRGLRLRPWQRQFARRTDLEMLEHCVLRLTLPFGFGHGDDALLPGPTDDTEFAVLTAQILVRSHGRPTEDDFVRAWQERLVSRADDVWTGFGEHMAIGNLRRGLRPPATGGDNPQFYDDGAVARAVSAGLACAGRPERAAELAQLDARLTHADEGVWAAQAMAAAIAVMASGGTLDDAVKAGRALFPADSWIAWVDGVVQDLLAAAANPAELALALSQQIITRTYSYANAAPETVPSAFALALATAGDVWPGVLMANTCARAADSLPAMVGALAGALQGPVAIPPGWEEALRRVRGICLPDLAGTDLRDVATDLTDLTQGGF